MSRFDKDNKITLHLTNQERMYVDDLVACGLWGYATDDVLREAIMELVRNAVKSGFISVRPKP